MEPGSNTDIFVSKSIIKMKENQVQRDPCKDYSYEDYQKCFQQEIRYSNYLFARAEIHQALLSQFSFLAEFLIEKVPVRDKDSRL